MVTLEELYNTWKDWSNQDYEAATKPASDFWNWLTDDEYWQDGVNYAKWMGADIPIIGYFFRTDDLTKYWNDYMKNTGLTWADVKYPTMLRGAGMYSGAAGSLNFLSSNVTRLYRDRFNRRMYR